MTARQSYAKQPAPARNGVGQRMLEHQPRRALSRSPADAMGRLPFPILRRRLGLLKWLVPAGLVLTVVAYELGPSRWVLIAGGSTYHLLADTLIYATVGPVLAFVLLELLGRWLEERETSELQARALAQAREHVRISRQLNDDALQTLFAASLLLDSMKSHMAALPSGVAAQLQEAQQALDRAIQQLHADLTHGTPTKGE